MENKNNSLGLTLIDKIDKMNNILDKQTEILIKLTNNTLTKNNNNVENDVEFISESLIVAYDLNKIRQENCSKKYKIFLFILTIIQHKIYLYNFIDVLSQNSYINFAVNIICKLLKITINQFYAFMMC